MFADSTSDETDNQLASGGDSIANQPAFGLHSTTAEWILLKAEPVAVVWKITNWNGV